MKTVLSMLFMLLVAVNIYAAESTVNVGTTDGRTFDSLTQEEIETLNAPDKAAYQTWDAARHSEESSSYQSSEGPNTMDISSDFSM